MEAAAAAAAAAFHTSPEAPTQSIPPKAPLNPAYLGRCARVHASFLQSLAFSSMWDASGGKSGARFERSEDGRYVTKVVSKTEYDMFVNDIAPHYFLYMLNTVCEGLPSALVKILGAFRVVQTVEEVVKGERLRVRHRIASHNLISV